MILSTRILRASSRLCCVRLSSGQSFGLRQELLKSVESAIAILPADRDPAFCFKDYLESVIKPGLEQPGGSLSQLSDEQLRKMKIILSSLQENAISREHRLPYDKFRGASLTPENVEDAIEALLQMKK